MQVCTPVATPAPLNSAPVKTSESSPSSEFQGNASETQAIVMRDPYFEKALESYPVQ